MLYGFIITALLAIAILWSRYVYKAAVHNSNSKLSWHRLVSNNIYVILLKVDGGVWEIEISLNSDDDFITAGIDNDRGMISVNVPKKRMLSDLVSHMNTMRLPSDELALFFKCLTNPIKASPLFPSRSDFESYNEVIFYITSTMELES